MYSSVPSGNDLAGGRTSTRASLAKAMGAGEATAGMEEPNAPALTPEADTGAGAVAAERAAPREPPFPSPEIPRAAGLGCAGSALAEKEPVAPPLTNGVPETFSSTPGVEGATEAGTGFGTDVGAATLCPDGACTTSVSVGTKRGGTLGGAVDILHPPFNTKSCRTIA